MKLLRDVVLNALAAVVSIAFIGALFFPLRLLRMLQPRDTVSKTPR